MSEGGSILHEKAPIEVGGTGSYWPTETADRARAAACRVQGVGSIVYGWGPSSDEAVRRDVELAKTMARIGEMAKVPVALVWLSEGHWEVRLGDELNIGCFTGATPKLALAAAWAAVVGGGVTA